MEFDDGASSPEAWRIQIEWLDFKNMLTSFLDNHINSLEINSDK